MTDAKGCSVTKDIFVPGATFTTVAEPSCCLANGVICVNACFGPQPYTYVWDNEMTGECISGLTAGTYCVTVTNANGDQFECCYTLVEHAATPPSVHFMYSNCGQSVQAVLGEFVCENYSGHWENGSTNPVRSNLTACDSLTYTLVGCDGTEYHFGFRVPNITASIMPVSCATGLGSICIDINCFRCPPYTYSWSTSEPVVQHGNCFSFPPGVYTLCITNACGDVYCCQYFLPNVIGDPITVSATVTDVLCWGQTNGTVTVSASGGTAPYTGTGVFNVGAGTYTYTVTDANGCTGSVTVHVNQPSEIIVHATATAILCHGDNSEVTVTAQGGTGPYQGIGVISLPAGTHVITVIDANGCVGTTTITIADPPPVVPVVTFNPIQCYGGFTGVTISGSGGVGPYFGSGNFSMFAGQYTVFVIDANGCRGGLTFTLPEPPKLEAAVNSNPATCGSANGSASVIASGGVAPYTYLWTPGGQTTPSVTNLAAGAYSVLVTDANGCTKNVSVIIANIGNAPGTPGAITGPAGVCRSTTGIVYSIAAVPGATSYVWTLPPGVSGSSTSNTITLAISNSYAGGFICVAAQNPCGTSAQSCMSIPVITTYPAVPGPIIGPAIICGPTTVTYSTTSFNATSYAWTVTGGGTIVSGQGTNTITVSIPAGFTQGAVQVTASNCFGTSAVRGLLITGIPAHSFGVTGPNMACANTSAVYSLPLVTGATSYGWTVTGAATLGTMTVNSSGVTQVINFGPSWISGTVSVAAVNPCGSYVKSFVVRSVPVQPGSVTGPTTGLCNTSATYTVAAVATATSYQWTVPAGASISGSATGSTVTIVFGPTFTSTSANICVSAVNSCGVGPQRCFAVTSRPGTPVVTGPTSVCKSQSAVAYSVAPVAGASSYVWQVTGGATISSSGVNATVNFNTSTISGVIVRSTAANSCGVGNPGLLNVGVSLACRTSEPVSPVSMFDVYPNPTSGELNVRIDASENGNVLIKLTDLPGNVLLTRKESVTKGDNYLDFDLADFAKGMYFLTVEGDGMEVRTVRIIVE
ncbi:MAG: T9SS type A sorting domain-containing protein [Bacteroidetes bacterium]|nr:T9SS type A sorting domain-containing protein [Bacteroidota bacterium]